MMRPWLSILKGILKGILNAYLSFFYFYRHISQLPSFQETKLIVEVKPHQQAYDSERKFKFMGKNGKKQYYGRR